MKNHWFRIIIAVIILLILILVTAIVLYHPKPHRLPVPESVNQSNEGKSPIFRNDGVLSFLNKKTGKQLCKIEIEVADNDASRTQGLMYRDGLPGMAGMLFMFEQEQPLAFWMRNTKIPLDIMFVDSAYHIINIAKNTTPYSEAQIPSDRPAKYVVEVNSGFSQKFGIGEGDKIYF